MCSVRRNSSVLKYKIIFFWDIDPCNPDIFPMPGTDALKRLESCFSPPSFRQVNVLPFRKSVIYFLPEDLRDSEIIQPPLVHFAGLGQDIFIANQNFSCFNLSPFPCVCYSLMLTWADLGVGRQAGAHNGSEPGFLLVCWDILSSDTAHGVWDRPGCREQGLRSRSGLKKGAELLAHKLRVRGFGDHMTKS